MKNQIPKIKSITLKQKTIILKLWITIYKWESKNKMPKLTFTVSQENDTQLREKNSDKGDMSNIINQALEQYFKKELQQ